jgi:hypothetical protein
MISPKPPQSAGEGDPLRKRRIVMNLGFSGSRHGMSEYQELCCRMLLAWAKTNWGDLIVRHGDCVGSDAKFHAMALSQGCTIYIHPSNLPYYQAGCKGWYWRGTPKPPLERNRDIVDHSAMLLATPRETSEVLRSGTWATIRYARKIERPLLVVPPEAGDFVVQAVGTRTTGDEPAVQSRRAVTLTVGQHNHLLNELRRLDGELEAQYQAAVEAAESKDL